MFNKANTIQLPTPKNVVINYKRSLVQLATQNDVSAIVHVRRAINNWYYG